jgi:hypothetical protein
LLRSCLVQPRVSVCAEAEHIATANNAATATTTRFPLLLIQVQRSAKDVVPVYSAEPHLVRAGGDS